jgi:hypothetical protein
MSNKRIFTFADKIDKKKRTVRVMHNTRKKSIDYTSILDK